ncbi:hypothetical protein AMJ57_03230 [Parcubacteria bacterium SG8_24]|nr:MAG: hypothetical protein AMJ57_03230 [Parcubacteria bacterium SG8_24]
MDQEPVYISAAGLDKLKKELDTLMTGRRREVARRIEKAREMGDLRENAEYHEAKDEAAFIEGRIAELKAMIGRAVIVEGGRSDTVNIGSRVQVSYGDGKEKTFVISGSTEADPLQGRISNESPIGRALMGRGVGDEVIVEVPSGATTYTIKKIE